MKEKLKEFTKSDAFKSIITSIICALIGIVIGYIVLLVINPAHSLEGLADILKGPFDSAKHEMRVTNFGTLLVKSSPLILAGCAILFAYKAGLFNIGAAGQYVMGSCACFFFALKLNAPWIVCLLAAVLTSAIWAAIVGVLKAYLNVNEVISGIMLNWIGLYITNEILRNPAIVDPHKSSETFKIITKSPSSLLPNLGLDKLFNDNSLVTIGIILAIIVPIIIMIILNKTTFGYEIKATGNNKNAAKYAGMNEKRNIILTVAISGALTGLAASVFYLTDIEYWTFPSSVPSMGFDGISAAFLGGLSPIGTIFSSLFIKYIQIGGGNLDTSYYNAEIANMVTAIIIYLCAFVSFLKVILTKIINKIKERKENEQKENKEAN